MTGAPAYRSWCFPTEQAPFEAIFQRQQPGLVSSEQGGIGRQQQAPQGKIQARPPRMGVSRNQAHTCPRFLPEPVGEGRETQVFDRLAGTRRPRPTPGTRRDAVSRSCRAA